MMTCIIARASAPSVPGRMGRCQSALAAVRCRTGSMHTILAPLRWASSMKGWRWRLVDNTLHAQMTMYFECTKLSGSTPAVGPRVMTWAVIAPPSQKVRSVTVVPSALKKGSPTVMPFSTPIWPR